MHIDRQYHKRIREEHMVSIQDDIPLCVVVYSITIDMEFYTLIKKKAPRLTPKTTKVLRISLGAILVN